MNKLGIIIPIRDRDQHLKRLLPSLKKTLIKQYIDYEIIIVEQSGSKPFNRGKLLNIGVERAIKLDCTYVALHDVDMIPIDVDYSFVSRPTHMATDFETADDTIRTIADDYFGGVTLFPIDDFLKLNGYSNKYWGWGYEDDDLLFRYRMAFDSYDTKEIYEELSNTVGFEFNGIDSSIKIPMDFKLKNYTILLSFEPNTIKCDEKTEIDEYSIFTIPGYDTGITYNSFKRYKFETWTTSRKVLTLNSNISEIKKTCIVVSVNQDENIIKLYQDGKFVDKLKYDGRLKNYKSVKEMIIGLSGSSDNNRIPFSGTVNYFALWNHSLEETQIKSIFDKLYMGVSEQFDGYSTPHCLEVCYDMKSSTNKTVYDLSLNNRHGIVHHCNRVPILQIAKVKEIIIPWRRNGKFKLLEHEENGYSGNMWTHPETRKNQIYFTSKVLTGKTDWRKDGISRLKYNIITETQNIKEKLTKIIVKI